MLNIRLFSSRRVTAVGVFLTILAAAWTLTLPPASQSGTVQAAASPLAAAQWSEAYGKIPLSFETNEGQTDQQVKFLSRGSGYTLFLTGDEAVLTLHRSDPKNLSREQLTALKAADFLSSHQSSAVLRMKLVGANASAKVSGVSEQEGKSNYFIGNDPKQWRTNVSNFAKVRYEDAYPGVDVVYYGNQQQLEYDFVVAPGADPRAITLDVAADSALGGKHRTAPLHLASNGDLLVPTDGGEVRFHKPVIYQPRESVDPRSVGGDPTLIASANSVDGHWVLRGSNQVGFEVSRYDSTLPLVIDPVLSYSTYIGGSNNDGAFGVAIDAAGNAYVAGFSNSTNFPTRTPLQKTIAGGIDTFILKLNRTGNALVYSTYLGGNSTDYPFGIAVDTLGNAYMVGNTGSTNFPTTTGAFQTTCVSCPANPDIFLTKLNPTGSALVYSTFMGGSGDDRAFGIALDKSYDAFIVGWTTSTNFPVSPDAFQTHNAGGQSDAFVAEMNAAGSALVYSTLLGGTGQDVGFGIAVDGTGNAFATGYSFSSNFPVTPAAFQQTTTAKGGAWVTKVNPGGASLAYSTYLGGTDGTSAGNSIKVDSGGNAYVTGFTCASDFPVTAGVFQPAFGGFCSTVGGDGFVTKLNPDGSAPVFSSYLGGNGDDVGFSIGLDNLNNSYITGRTTSTNYPVTPGAFQPTNAGTYDTMFTIVNPTGYFLLYSTYLGGGMADVAFVMAVDKPGNAYIIGRTYSRDFPVTPGAFQTILHGTTNAIVYKFSPGNQVWPTTLGFGNIAVGTASAPLTTKLTNSGTAPLTISGISITGAAAADYAQSEDCADSLAVGTSCTVTVTFTPSASGARAASLVITDGSVNSPHTVTLTGTGSSLSASLSPATLTFPTQVLNTGSASLPATLTNTGSGAVTISNIATTGAYSQTNNCGTSLAVGASCTINVVFAPTAIGTQTGNLTVTDNAGSPQVTALSGVGTAVSFSPTTLGFGSQTVGTASTPKSVTMTNMGTATINITNIFISGARTTSFSQTNNCGTSLASGASCTINVSFTPKLKGSLTANVSVMDNGGGAPQNITLSGTGT